jgi:hypothetical protein
MTDSIGVRSPLRTASLASFAADFGHVFTICTHCRSALAASGACFIACKPVSRSLRMRSLAPLARYLALFFRIHGPEASGRGTMGFLVRLLVLVVFIHDMRSP